MTKLNHYRLQALSDQAQSGQAAFAVTLIIMIVLSLIVLGYANNSRNEQRRALDDQLNTAAFYAAESGINDAYAVIKTDLENNITPLVAQTSCTGPYSSNSTNSLVTLDASGTTIAYTCLLVNPTPSALNFAPMPTGHGQVVPVTAANGSNINIISISWQQDGLTTNTDFTGCPPASALNQFPERNLWSPNCTAGVLQVDMVPASGWSSLTDLQKDANTVFLVPQQSSGNLSGNPSQNSVSPSNSGEVIGVKCGADSGGKYDCTTELVVTPGNGYYLHIVPIYDNADVSITAFDPSGHQVDLGDAQALIDSTGKANDELKRIQEYISINPIDKNDAPVNALQSLSGICKTLLTRPGQTTNILNSCN